MLSSSDLLRFLAEITLILASARGLGEMFRRLNQPQVIGELLAGVALGPSLLGALAPSGYETLFPSQGTPSLLLQAIAQIGVILLLLLSGLEVDVTLLRRKAKRALWVALGGVAVPFLSGYGLATLLPLSLVGHLQERSVFLLFVATAMSISAIPVIVKILLDMDLMRRDVGQLTVAAGVINDSVGWFLLALVSGAATARALPVTQLTLSIFGTLAFAAFCFTLGYRLIRLLVHWVDDHFGGHSATLTAVLLVGLGGAVITQALHVEAFLGAFLVGVQLSRIPRVTRSARRQLEAMTLGVFAPIFFATAGLHVNIPALLNPTLLTVLTAVVLVACLGKFIGTFAGARLAGLSPWLSAALGAGMNARGAVEIIVATVGLQMGVLTIPMYSIIVAMAVLTSIAAPPLLRWTLNRVPLDPEEDQRLRREAREARSFLYSLQRMLVPVRDGRYALVAAELVGHLAGTRAVEAIALHIGSEGNTGETLPWPRQNGSAEWKLRTVADSGDIAKAIVLEAERDYDLLVLGAPGRQPVSGLFGKVVDSVVRSTPCATLVLRAPQWREAEVRLRRILLPTTGTRSDLRAAEFAIALALATGSEVLAIHVVDTFPLAEPFGGHALETLQAAEAHARHATSAVVALGDELGVTVHEIVRTIAGRAASDELVRYAALNSCDLILMHAQQREAGEELYCGRTVQRILSDAGCPVAILLDPANSQ